jgi:hypothetical protein
MAVVEPAPGGDVKLFNRWTFEDVQVSLLLLPLHRPPQRILPAAD